MNWLRIVFEIPALRTLRHNPAVSREIMRKWRPPVEADDRKIGDLHAALISLIYSCCTSMIFYIKVIVVLLLINTITLQIRVSFSFNVARVLEQSLTFTYLRKI